MPQNTHINLSGLFDNHLTLFPHVVQARAEGPEAPSPGHRPGYTSNHPYALNQRSPARSGIENRWPKGKAKVRGKSFKNPCNPCLFLSPFHLRLRRHIVMALFYGHSIWHTLYLQRYLSSDLISFCKLYAPLYEKIPQFAELFSDSL